MQRENKISNFQNFIDNMQNFGGGTNKACVKYSVNFINAI